ncbi:MULTISPECIES: holin-associated N-acetylmuramidase [unclassified Haematobacter]|uniref:holin-associated N-acetylmuramidase n=1 Tax=unclassified Haematobacter TaxID=2640585 RepID=UPI0025C5E42B|nr:MULTISPECIES: holin-associated N-acetylmuramidase [unclassified Haematobacter]
MPPSRHLSIRRVAEEIVLREGGYVNDPDDPGGATNLGITLKTLRGLGLDIDGDGRVTENDLLALTPPMATDIYLEHYWRRPRLDLLPGALQPPVFDMRVHSGDTAVRLLQEMLGRLGQPCAVDGIVGPQTAAATRRAARQAGEDRLAESYGIARRDYYYRLADRRPASRKYCLRRDGGKGGWIVRAEAFLPAALHYTPAQHRARVSAWL